MILANQYVIIKWNSRNKKTYESKGYIFTKMNDPFNVKMEDLEKGCKSKIKIECDYCKSIFERPYYVHLKITQQSIINKDCYPECKGKKAGEVNRILNIKDNNRNEIIQNKIKSTMMDKYGVENAMQSQEIKNKIKQTNLEKYGTESPLQSEIIREKIKNTCIIKYGVDNPAKSQEIKTKMKKTNLKKYGVEYILQSKEIKDKMCCTVLKKYGVINISQCKEIQSKIRHTLYENGKVPSSRQQIYIYKLLSNNLNCKLNYPLDYYSLDIALPDEKINIEYDGGGHKLCVKRGDITENEFNQIEIKRNKIIKSKGWKIIRIVSSNDLLPQDNDIINLINKAIKYLLNTNHTWVEINIDKLLYINIEQSINIELKNLHQITSNMIK